MKVGLIDADLLDGGTRFPNLALMKISGYWSNRGAETSLVQNFADALECERLFCSKVFTKTRTPDWLGLVGERCEFGGTGFRLYDAPPLPDDVEHSRPDYSLYAPFVESFAKAPSWLASYTKSSVGFTTRGCVRQCPFCVNRNKTEVELWSPVGEFLDETRPYVELLDDNVFAYRRDAEIFEQLEATGKRFCYKQGLDVRFLTKRRAETLERVRYYGDVIFAFDNVADADVFKRKAELYRTYCRKPTKAYLLCGFYKNGIDELRDLFKRIEILSRFKIRPYVMRHENVANDAFAPIYVDIARWANQPAFFVKESFSQFVVQNGSKKSKDIFTSSATKGVRKQFDKFFWMSS